MSYDPKLNYANLDPDELRLVEIAQEKFGDAFDLAIRTQDEDLFFNVMKKAHELYTEEILGKLINEGLVNMAGVDETGDFTFELTEHGKKVAESYRDRDNV